MFAVEPRPASMKVIVVTNPQRLAGLRAQEGFAQFAARWPDITWRLATAAEVGAEPGAIGTEQDSSRLMPDMTRFLSVREDAPDVVFVISQDRDSLDIASQPDSADDEEVVVGASESAIFQLARAGDHVGALETLAALPIETLTSHSRIAGIRAAAAGIDIDDPRHGVHTLALRLQLSVTPPLESATLRDAIQKALLRAQAVSTTDSAIEATGLATAAHS